ncbi:hypothetical protein L7F22_012858 [Adiantum nelumboides]|nr:hypothetical protein [Adiantum nelumboides]
MWMTTESYWVSSWQRRSSALLQLNFHSSSPDRIKSQAQKKRLAIWCQGWFEFISDLSGGSGDQIHAGDFKVLSHLKELGCRDLVCKPKAIHFRGCINESYQFNCTGGKYFVKVNRSFKASEMFASEFEGLQKLHLMKAICVPQPLGFGDLPDCGSYIIMEHLQFQPFGMMQKKSQKALGRSLALLHQYDVGDLFGFCLNTRLGVMPLENRWASSWTDFFLENRLKDRLKRVYAAIGESAMELQSKEGMLLKRVEEVLCSYTCKPCLLHGDLWMGNTGLTSTGEVAMFDPATFIGDAEFDLAFQGWSPVPGFPGFSDAFYDSYHAMLPREPGFLDRRKVYQLFHLLNHLLIYGLEYYKHVLAMVDSLLLD